MDRREFIGVAVSLPVFSGCSRFQNDRNIEVQASLEIENEFCEERDPEVRITEHTDGKIEYEGTIQSVKEGYGIDPDIFVSSKEKEIFCRITSYEGIGPPSVNCSGSVEYSGTIEYSNIEINSAWFVHEVDGEQGLGKTIATESG